MTTFSLSTNFASQSIGRISASVVGGEIAGLVPTDGGRGIALWMSASLGRAGFVTLRLRGLMPGRFYRLDGMCIGFRRAGDDGELAVRIACQGEAILTVHPVV